MNGVTDEGQYDVETPGKYFAWGFGAFLVGVILFSPKGLNIGNWILPYLKMGGVYILGLVAVAVLCAVIGFAVSAGWRLGKRLEKEEG